MPGMNSGLGISNPLVTEAFRAALKNQLFIVAAIFLLLWLARLTAATWWPASGKPAGLGAGQANRTGQDGWAGAEPTGRLVLRIGFGLLWIFDGILQAQPSMPLGLTPQVIEPSAQTSPAWVRHLVNWAGTTWTYHPVQISAAAVWIQVGIGLWLLVARRGRWSRLGALASVGWGLGVWVFGESFGGIFAPGLTWLFGAPGAVLFYCVAGALIALPWSAWRTPRLGRLVLAGMGVFFTGMAVLQAWPGRGFWQGGTSRRPGTLTAMVQQMAQTPQPHFLARLVASFADFTTAHGFAVNLFTVIALAVIGLTFLSGRPWLARLGVAAGIVLCLADWVLIEDFGFLGGLGTDPNRMVPMALVFTAGYLAMTRTAAQPAVAAKQAAAAEPAPAAEPGLAAESAPGRPRTARPLVAWPRWGSRAMARASDGSVAAAGALGMVLVGVIPSAAASASRHADPIIAEAIGGTAGHVNYPAGNFALTDQHGAPVSLASLHGKVVLLTFLDPVCTSDCPLIGHELVAAGQMLAADSSRIRLAAIVLSPTYRSLAAIQAYDRQEGLNRNPDWLYMTGSLAQLKKVWHEYGVTAQDLPAGAMTLHNDVGYVIDGRGHVRQVLNTEPGPGTSASVSSFAAQFADAARQVLSSS